MNEEKEKYIKILEQQIEDLAKLKKVAEPELSIKATHEISQIALLIIDIQRQSLNNVNNQW